jgi:hypothetical protein
VVGQLVETFFFSIHSSRGRTQILILTFRPLTSILCTYQNPQCQNQSPKEKEKANVIVSVYFCFINHKTIQKGERDKSVGGIHVV